MIAFQNKNKNKTIDMGEALKNKKEDFWLFVKDIYLYLKGKSPL